MDIGIDRGSGKSKSKDICKDQATEMETGRGEESIRDGGTGKPEDDDKTTAGGRSVNIGKELHTGVKTTAGGHTLKIDEEQHTASKTTAGGHIFKIDEEQDTASKTTACGHVLKIDEEQETASKTTASGALLNLVKDEDAGGTTAGGDILDTGTDGGTLKIGEEQHTGVKTTAASDPLDIIPQDEISHAAYAHVERHLQPAILAHSLRVFFYAQALSARQSNDQETAWHLDERLPFLFTACIFHDFGACSLNDDGQHRFEIEGADAAVEFFQSRGIKPDEAHAVWIAIACHTSPQIGERISTLARILRQAALSDFHRMSDVQVVTEELTSSGRLFVLEAEVRHIEERFPRIHIEQVLADSIVAQARRDRRHAPPSSWPADLLRAAEEEIEWKGVNKAF